MLLLCTTQCLLAELRKIHSRLHCYNQVVSSSRNHESFEAGTVGYFSRKNPMRDLNFRLPADYINSGYENEL